MSIETELKDIQKPAIPELYEIYGNGYLWRYTSYKVGVTFAGNYYRAATIKRSGFTRSRVPGDSKVTVTFPIMDPVKTYVSSYPIQNVRIRIYQAIAPAMVSYALLFEGKIKKVSLTGRVLTSECGIDDDLTQLLPHIVYQSYCNWTVFDRNCGLECNDWLVDGVITTHAQNGLYISSPTFATYETGWFSQGMAEYDGDRRLIISHEGSQLLLQVPFVVGENIVGKTVQATPGCNGSPSTCKNKFHNFTLRHVSMPYIPSHNPTIWGFK
jgi:uncharacterized phage protein (TIGR02218 family)